MGRGEKLIKNTFILAIGTFLPKFTSFITLPILTGMLSMEEYGTYDLIIVLVSLFLPAITLQIQTAAFRFLIDDRKDEKKVKNIISNIYAFVIPVSIVGVVILFFCLFKISISIRIAICLYYISDIMVSTTRQVARGISQNFKYSISAILNSLFQLIFVVAFVRIIKKGLFGAIIALSMSSIISFIYLLFSLKLYNFIDLSLLSIKEIKKLLNYSWPMVPNSMSMWIMRMSDRIVISLFMGVTSNAIYSVANKIPQLLTIAQNTFTMAWQENASIVSKDKDVQKYYSNMFKVLFNLMSGTMGLIISLTPLLFVILIQGNYYDAYIQIPILLFSMFFLSMSTFLGGIYVAYMKTKSVGITTIISAVINLLVDILLINKIGLFAASISTLISYIFLFIYRLVDIQKFVKIKFKKKNMSIIFLIMIIECILCSINNLYINILNIVISVSTFILLNKSFLSIILKKFFLKTKKKGLA